MKGNEMLKPRGTRACAGKALHSANQGSAGGGGQPRVSKTPAHSRSRTITAAQKDLPDKSDATPREAMVGTVE